MDMQHRQEIENLKKSYAHMTACNSLRRVVSLKYQQETKQKKENLRWCFYRWHARMIVTPNSIALCSTNFKKQMPTASDMSIEDRLLIQRLHKCLAPHSEDVWKLLQEVFQKGEIQKVEFQQQSSLGISIESWVRRGCTVTNVVPGSPAESKGIKVGDRITEANGIDLSSLQARKIQELFGSIVRAPLYLVLERPVTVLSDRKHSILQGPQKVRRRPLASPAKRF